LAETAFDPALHIALECEATRSFIDLLLREQSALQQADLSKLEPLAEEKTYHLQQLAQLTDARNHWLAGLGYSSDRAGMERGLGDCPDVAGSWAELLRLARTAVHINKVNGLLIDQRLRYNQQTLTVLRAAAQDTSLYGSDGQPRPFCGRRELGAG